MKGDYWKDSKMREHISNYLNETDKVKRDIIFSKHIIKPLTKMANDIHGVYFQKANILVDSDQQQIHIKEAIAQAASKLGYYKGTSNSFSYFQTIVKNYYYSVYVEKRIKKSVLRNNDNIRIDYLTENGFENVDTLIYNYHNDISTVEIKEQIEALVKKLKVTDIKGVGLKRIHLIVIDFLNENKENFSFFSLIHYLLSNKVTSSQMTHYFAKVHNYRINLKYIRDVQGIEKDENDNYESENGWWYEKD